MRVADIMATSVATVGVDEAAEAAADLMQLHRIHHLLVMSNGQLVGILSDRDIGGRRGGPLREGRTVRDLMTPNVTTIAKNATVRRAANLMRGRTIGCLPVVNGRGRVLGIITTSDLLELVGRGAERPVERRRRWTLKHRGLRKAPRSA